MDSYSKINTLHRMDLVKPTILGLRSKLEEDMSGKIYTNSPTIMVALWSAEMTE